MPIDRVTRPNKERYFFNRLITQRYLNSSHFSGGKKKKNEERVTNHAIADARREIWCGLF